MRTKEHQVNAEEKKKFVILYSSAPCHLSFIDHYYIFLLTFSSQTEEKLTYLVTHHREILNSSHILTETLYKDH